MHLATYLAILLMISLLLPSMSEATRHALLVGINAYSLKPLSGPVNDVEAIKHTLITHWQFDEPHINVLLDEQATKKNIMQAIQRLFKISQSGDEIFIYLSGHGTSAGDKSFRPVLPTTSGAFLPFDAHLGMSQAKNIEAIFDSLVIGRVDLQPLLIPLDQGGRHVFVVIDACYSGNTVRGMAGELKRLLPSRNITFSTLVKRSGIFASDFDIDKMFKKKWKNKTIDRYPYKNVYYLAASGEYEPAQDISLDKLPFYPTHDGKPHGAFSDTLLRVLTKQTKADLDNNGYISYGELINTLRFQMRRRGFSHTPRGLPSLADDQTLLYNKPMFGSLPLRQTAPKTPVSTPLSSLTITPFGQPLRIKLAPSFVDLTQRIHSHPLLMSDSQVFDIELRQAALTTRFISKAGDVLLQLYQPSLEKILQTLVYQITAARLAHQPSSQPFNMTLELDQADKTSTLANGDLIGFSITSQQAAYILLINIDAMGNVNVIYPRHPTELQPMKAQQPLQLAKLTTVIPPLGREYVIAYAFTQFDKTLEKIRQHSTFTLDSAMSNQMLQMIDKHKTTLAKTSLELYTVKRESQ